MGRRERSDRGRGREGDDITFSGRVRASRRARNSDPLYLKIETYVPRRSLSSYLSSTLMVFTWRTSCSVLLLAAWSLAFPKRGIIIE